MGLFRVLGNVIFDGTKLVLAKEPSEMSQAEKANLVSLIDGKSIEELSEELGIPRTHVWRLRKQLGLLNNSVGSSKSTAARRRAKSTTNDDDDDWSID